MTTYGFCATFVLCTFLIMCATVPGFFEGVWALRYWIAGISVLLGGALLMESSQDDSWMSEEEHEGL